MALEKDFKASVQKKLKKMGCTVLQYKQDSTTVKGFPDTIVILPESLVVFIEWKKTSRSKFQPLQKEWNAKLNERGFFAYICHPDNADEVVEEIRRLI